MAIRVRMRRWNDAEGGPHFTPARRIDAEFINELKPGEYVNKISRLRSRKAHNYYFLAIDRACENWPRQDEPCPEGDEKKLRAWLQCKAGPKWRKNIDGPPESVEMAIKIIEALAGEGRYAFVDTVVMTDAGPKLRVHIPVSVNEYDMPGDEFIELETAVFEVLELKFGCTIQELIDGGEAQVVNA